MPCSSWSVPHPAPSSPRGTSGPGQGRTKVVVGSPSAGLGSTVKSSLPALPEQEQGLHTAPSSPQSTYFACCPWGWGPGSLGEPGLVPILCPGGGDSDCPGTWAPGKPYVGLKPSLANVPSVPTLASPGICHGSLRPGSLRQHLQKTNQVPLTPWSPRLSSPSLTGVPPSSPWAQYSTLRSRTL